MGFSSFSLSFLNSIDDVTWEGKDIKVMEQVTIKPPYLPENIVGSLQADKAVNHVRKIVSSTRFFIFAFNDAANQFQWFVIGR